MGSWSGIGFTLSELSMSASTFAKSARSWSMRPTTAIAGTLDSARTSKWRSAWLCAPSAAEMARSAPSVTRSAQSTSARKEANPGVSSAWKVRSPSSKLSGWMLSVKLRFCSSGPASRREVEPSGLARFASTRRRKASTRAVLPAPSAPVMEKVLMVLGMGDALPEKENRLAPTGLPASMNRRLVTQYHAIRPHRGRGGVASRRGPERAPARSHAAENGRARPEDRTGARTGAAERRLEVVAGRERAADEVPRVVALGRAEGPGGLRALDLDAVRRRREARPRVVEADADVRLERELRDAEEPEEHLEAGRGAEREEVPREVEVRARVRGLDGRADVDEVDGGHELEGDVLAAGEHERQAGVEAEPTRARRIDGDRRGALRGRGAAAREEEPDAEIEAPLLEEAAGRRAGQPVAHAEVRHAELHRRGAGVRRADEREGLLAVEADAEVAADRLAVGHVRRRRSGRWRGRDGLQRDGGRRQGDRLRRLGLGATAQAQRRRQGGAGQDLFEAHHDSSDEVVGRRDWPPHPAGEWAASRGPAAPRPIRGGGRSLPRSPDILNKTRTVVRAAGRWVKGLPAVLQLWEVVLPELPGPTSAAPARPLGGPQRDAADLAGDGLRQVRELEPAHALVRREPSADEPEDVEREVARGRLPGLQDEERLRHDATDRVGARDDRRLRDGLVLDERALQLERADAVVGALEDVVPAPDVGDVPLVVPRGDVAGPVVAAARRVLRQRRVVEIAGHEPHGARLERERDLALGGLLAARVEERDPEAGHGAAHRAGLHLLSGRVADLAGGLRLAIAVADRDPPRLLHAVDHLGVERLAGAERLSQLHLVRGEVLEDEEAPHGGRRAPRRDLVAGEHLERAPRAEAGVVVHEHGRAGVERRVEVRPGVLPPPRRADVHVHVALADAEPVHRGEVADRIARVRVEHELRLRGRAGGEVQEHRVVRVRVALRQEDAALVVRLVVGRPPGDLLADDHLREARVERAQLLRARRVGDDGLHPAAVEGVAHVLGREERGRRDDDGAELHRAEHDLPDRDRVREHHEHAMPPLDAHPAQEDGHAIRALGELGVRQLHLAPVVLHDVERGVPVPLGEDVEPVHGPVEAIEDRPGEAAVGGVVV